MTKCQPECTCKRHNRVISSEHRQNIAKANAARKGESHKCPEGCTCDRHKAYYRGGSKKGRKFSEQGRENLSVAAKQRSAEPKERQRFAKMAAEARQNPELEAKRIAAVQAALTGTSCPEGCQCGKHSQEARQRLSEYRTGLSHTDEVKEKIGKHSQEMWDNMSPEQHAAIMIKRSESLKASWALEKSEDRVRQTGGYLHSKHELSLIPYMKALGYAHNTDGKYWVGRRVPDFIDYEGKRIYEYFGSYWHPRPEEEAEVIDYYQLYGYECFVLWEHDLYSFLINNRELVTEDEHELAWRCAKVNNGYKKA